MGLAASQARALLLVARKSDLEYRSQCISQRKIVLSQQTEQLAKDYNTKISNRKLRFVYNLDGNSSTSMYEDLSYYSLSAENPKFVGSYRVLNNRGDIVVASYKDIPYVEKKIPVYAKIDTTGEWDMTPEYKYVESDKELGAKESTKDDAAYENLYVQGTDGKYYQVQGKDSEGKPIVHKPNNGDIAFSTEYNDAKLYSQKTTYNYSETTTNDKSADTANWKILSYTTQKLPRPQSSDGYYYSDDGRRYIICEDIAKNNYFQNGLRTGAFILQKENTIEETDDDGNKTGKEYTTWESTPWQGIDVINDVLYTEDDALAESEYEAKTAVIKTQDQMLDLELKQIETQHKAIETEEESVKKVIQSNIEKTFKIFA